MKIKFLNKKCENLILIIMDIIQIFNVFFKIEMFTIIIIITRSILREIKRDDGKNK